MSNVFAQFIKIYFLSFFFDVFAVFVGRGGFRHIVRRETTVLPYGLERGNGRTEGISCVRPQTSVNKPSLLRQAVPPLLMGETLKEAVGGLNKKNCSDCMKKTTNACFLSDIVTDLQKNTKKENKRENFHRIFTLKC